MVNHSTLVSKGSVWSLPWRAARPARAIFQTLGPLLPALTPCPYLGPGDAARAQEGPLQGYLDVVVRKKGSRRLVVSVPMLRRSGVVEMERESLAPDPAAPGRAGGERRAPSTGLGA